MHKAATGNLRLIAHLFFTMVFALQAQAEEPPAESKIKCAQQFAAIVARESRMIAKEGVDLIGGSFKELAQATSTYGRAIRADGWRRIFRRNLDPGEPRPSLWQELFAPVEVEDPNEAGISFLAKLWRRGQIRASLPVMGERRIWIPDPVSPVVELGARRILREDQVLSVPAKLLSSMVVGGVPIAILITPRFERWERDTMRGNADQFQLENSHRFQHLRQKLANGELDPAAALEIVAKRSQAAIDYLDIVDELFTKNPEAFARGTDAEKILLVAQQFQGLFHSEDLPGIFEDFNYFQSQSFASNKAFRWQKKNPAELTEDEWLAILPQLFAINHFQVYLTLVTDAWFTQDMSESEIESSFGETGLRIYRELQRDPYVAELLGERRKGNLSQEQAFRLIEFDNFWRGRFDSLRLFGAEMVGPDGVAATPDDLRCQFLRRENVSIPWRKQHCRKP